MEHTRRHDGERRPPEGRRMVAPLRRRPNLGRDFERDGLLANFYFGEGVGVKTERETADLLLRRQPCRNETNEQ